jgi:hypothetical protein
MCETSTADARDERWVAALLSLAREVWVLKDRQRIVEERLAARGVLVPAEIEAWQPTPEQQAVLDRECRAFVDRLVQEIVPGAGPK